MTVDTHTLADSIELVVKGNIKTVEDSDNLKNAVADALSEGAGKKLVINVEDSYIMTSSVIGFLARKIGKERANIELLVKNSDLYALLNNLQVVTLLNVKR